LLWGDGDTATFVFLYSSIRSPA